MQFCGCFAIIQANGIQKEEICIPREFDGFLFPLYITRRGLLPMSFERCIIAYPELVGSSSLFLRKRGRQSVNHGPNIRHTPRRSRKFHGGGCLENAVFERHPVRGIKSGRSPQAYVGCSFTGQAAFDRLSAERTVMSRSTQGFCEFRKRGHSPQPRVSRKQSFRKTSLAAESQSGRRPRCVCRMFFSSMP